MLFTSWAFVLLVLASVAVFYLLPHRRQQVWTLIVASLVFYGYGQPALLTLLIGLPGADEASRGDAELPALRAHVSGHRRAVGRARHQLRRTRERAGLHVSGH